MNAILIVTYNTHFFLDAQLTQIRALCAEDVDIFILDNTPRANSTVSNALREISQAHSAQYFYIGYEHPSGSLAHAYALNTGLAMLGEKGYATVCMIDHDIIPFKEFHIESNFILRGLKQQRGEVIYAAPVFLVLNLIKIPPFDLSPAFINGEQLDTGASTALIINNLHNDQIQFISQEHRFKNTNKFHEILDGSLFHFIRGSNWGLPESPALSVEENDLKLRNLSEEYNKLSQGLKL